MLRTYVNDIFVLIKNGFAFFYYTAIMLYFYICLLYTSTGLNWKQAVRISSLEKKPENGQIPEIARQAIRNVQWVTSMNL